MSLESVNEGLQEDGRTFLTFVNNESTENNEEVVIDGTESADDLGKVVDALEEGMKDLPEATRSRFTETLGKLKTRIAELGGLKHKADMVDVLLQQRENRSAGDDGGTEPEKRGGKKSLFDGVKFEEKDYYAPFFKKTFDAIDAVLNKIESLEGSLMVEKKETFESATKNFFKTNKVPKEVVLKMDEIARDLGGGIKAYKDLPRLLKLAKSELGIVDKKETTSPQPARKTKTRSSSSVELSSARKSQTEPRKITSMAEAFAQAEDDLREKDE